MGSLQATLVGAAALGPVGTGGAGGAPLLGSESVWSNKVVLAKYVGIRFQSSILYEARDAESL
jgi:hypothetical protein